MTRYMYVLPFMAIISILSGRGSSADEPYDNPYEIIFCWLQDTVSKKKYFTDVFTTEDGHTEIPVVARVFTEFVHGKYPGVSGVAGCSYEISRSTAQERVSAMIADAKAQGFKTELTNWKY